MKCLILMILKCRFAVKAEKRSVGYSPARAALLTRLAKLTLWSFRLQEYNGSYTAAFKNVFDWASRIDMKKEVYQGKPVVMLARITGPRRRNISCYLLL
ncbi:NAD(P)H-dependent oxidoreductase [Vibrio lentus]|nr:NAD(P)H-dependent oxidoreductase [Vibrio lentus]